VYDSLSEVCDYLETYLNAGQNSLGLARPVIYSDTNVAVRFPCVQMIPEAKVREWQYAGGGLERGLIKRFRVQLFVMHANLQMNKPLRSKANIAKAEEVSSYLDADYTLGGNIIQGWVTAEDFTLLPTPKGQAVVATRLTWEGESR